MTVSRIALFAFYVASLMLVAVPVAWADAVPTVTKSGRARYEHPDRKPLAGYRSVLYPKSNQAIASAHDKHKGIVACVRCHAGIKKSISATDTHMPKESVCQGCHILETRMDRSRKTAPAGKNRCTWCHLGKSRAKLAAGKVPIKLRLPQARLRFSHRLHSERQIPCGSCHDMTKANAHGKRMPSMDRCVSCHREKKVSTRCITCHLSGKDGRLKKRFGDDRMAPRRRQSGGVHTPQFRRMHRVAALNSKKTCSKCHSRSECLECHAGIKKPMSIHRSDYISNHALDARRNQPKCQSCHRTQTFCLSCHLRSGVGQRSSRAGFGPVSNRRYHKPEFTSHVAGPGHHKFAARRRPQTCASCHRESTCIRCHGTSGARRGGFSPHPPNFRSSNLCRNLYRANRRVCTKCHMPGQGNITCR